MDNFKIIYKILKILERAMDEDSFDKSEISFEELKISEARWIKLMEMLASEGYIQGVSIINSLGRTHLRITLKGLEYLEENSLMKKAGHLIKGVTEIIK